MKTFRLVLPVVLASALHSWAQPSPPAEFNLPAALNRASKLRAQGDLAAAKNVVSLAFTNKPIENPEVLAELFRRDTTYFEAAKLLGSIELQFGNTNRALQVYKQALDAKEKVNLKDGEIYNRLGWAYYVNGDYAHAKDQLRKAMFTEEPITEATRAKAYNNLGFLYFSTGDLDTSEEIFRQSKSKFNGSFADQSLKQIESFKQLKKEIEGGTPTPIRN